MENISRALILAGSALLFVIGFSYSMYLITKLSNTSKTVVDSITTTSYYDNISYNGTAPEAGDRIVGIDTVISTIYRYYKEGYSVKILDKDGNNIQVFDIAIEDKIRRLEKMSDKTSNEYVILSSSSYCDKNSKDYMFNAPWSANTEYTLTRIDFFLHGTKGYINNVLVDYSENSKLFNGVNGGFIAKYNSKNFLESFTEYVYSGESISTDEGLETITGSTQEKNKILITYKVIE